MTEIPVTCQIEPFRYQSTPQPGSEDGASGNQINEQALEDYLNRLRTAICEDLTEIFEGGDVVLSFLQLTDTPDSYVGFGGRPVLVNVAENGLEFGNFPDPPDVFTALDTWINYSFGLVAGTPLQTIGNGGGISAPNATSTIPALATTNASTSTYKVQFVTTNATNQIAYVAINTLLVAIGSSQGFRWRAVVGGNSTVTNQRAFWGLRAAITTPTSVEPSSQTDIIGFGYDAGDATLHVFHNDNAGTATDIPLGANFPVATGELFEVILECSPGSGTVDYSIRRLNTGDTATGTISTELPAGTQFLSAATWVATAGNAGIAQLWFHHQFISEF